MGLDMYLHRYPKNMTKEEREAKSNELWEKGIDVWRKEFKDKFQVAYWRKVNFLHGWIVDKLADGIDECQEIEVSRADIDTLLSLCEEAIGVLEKAEFIPMKEKDKCIWKNEYFPEYEEDKDEPRIPVLWDGESFAGLDGSKYYKIGGDYARKALFKILPPRDGLFFGSTSLDEYYAFDMFELKDTLNRIISEWDDSYVYIYRASW